MSTIDQNELARQAEQLNDAQWYEFLDALDEVAKRRRQRGAEIPEQPDDCSREGVAAWIARNHLANDPSVREIWYLPAGADTEIRLVEINERIEGGGDELNPIDFVIDVAGISYTLLIVDLTGDQLAQVRSGQLALPDGWHFEDAKLVGRRGP